MPGCSNLQGWRMTRGCGSSKRFFGLRYHGSPLADQEVSLPSKLRVSGLSGGTALWERAHVAWELNRTMSEFDDLSLEDQNYALATWRTMQKLENIKVIEQARKS